MDIRFFDELESTNTYCELLDLSQVEEFTIVCARSQTAGRGQRDHHWESEPGQNLTFSLILHPDFLSLADQFLLTKVLSLGVCDLIQSVAPQAHVLVKWPNDIYIGYRKVCGILVSNRASAGCIVSSVCGVGLNVNQISFPDWIPNPVSLRQVTGAPLDVEALLPMLADCIERRYLALKSSPTALDADYLSHLFRLGQLSPYLYKGTALEARIKGVDRLGGLILQTADGDTLVCQHGEVSFVLDGSL